MMLKIHYGKWVSCILQINIFQAITESIATGLRFVLKLQEKLETKDSIVA